ncbi:hypothetical protein KVT40_004758 [Elsinoe batatas]|uniref:Uncharacterized protein n=1 Tax=Elsinoe batatas TaxID=2601811 RepID=A0A8K0L1N8_9PEZI|nr:hypothetical protein KVT40_004758 [Elsinoe batatas]
MLASSSTKSIPSPRSRPASKPPLSRSSTSCSSLPAIPEIAINGTITSTSTKSHTQNKEQITTSYRARYAAYLAATFGISLEAAQADVASVLTPRKRSDTSEEEVEMVWRGRSIL